MRVMDPETAPEDLAPAEFAQAFVLTRAVLQKYQGQWALWQEGILPDEMWQNRRRWAKSLVSLPVPGRIWERETDQHQYADGFVESINSASSSGNLTFRA